jgi:hypothetical protein
MNATAPASRQYNPLYFLASLGAGGLAVTFFMALMFWIAHPGQPVPVFEDLQRAFASGDIGLRSVIIVAALGIAYFAFQNVRMLVWNLRSLAAFRKTDAYTQLRRSNAETTLLAAPLAAAMSVNVGFIVGLVFVPGLWGVVEYLFPLALVVFAGIGVWAARLIGQFLARALTEQGGFNVDANNSFAQLLPAFALAMVAVGFAAPAAMSTLPTTVAISLVGSTLFGTVAALYAIVAAVTGFAAMLKNGVAREAGPTLMVVVPILTVLGIMSLRQSHGVHTTFDSHGTSVDTLLFLAKLLSVQLAFLALGLLVLARQGYWSTFVFGETRSAGSYALVCPGVALSVMIHFFVNKGLVGAGVIAKFGIAYWSLTGTAILVQIAMIGLVLILNRAHFREAARDALAPTT